MAAATTESKTAYSKILWPMLRPFFSLPVIAPKPEWQNPNDKIQINDKCQIFNLSLVFGNSFVIWRLPLVIVFFSRLTNLMRFVKTVLHCQKLRLYRISHIDDHRQKNKTKHGKEYRVFNHGLTFTKLNHISPHKNTLLLR